MQISEQINCVQMEVKRRERVMPMMAKEGAMSEERSSLEIARMKAVLETLHQVKGGSYKSD